MEGFLNGRNVLNPQSQILELCIQFPPFSAYWSQPWEHNSPNSGGSLGLNLKLKESPFIEYMFLFTKGSQAQTTSCWTLAIYSIRYDFKRKKACCLKKISLSSFQTDDFAFLGFALFTTQRVGIQLINEKPLPDRVRLGYTHTIKKCKYNL